MFLASCHRSQSALLLTKGTASATVFPAWIIFAPFLIMVEQSQRHRGNTW